MKHIAGLLVIAGLWGIARGYAAPPDETVPWRKDSNPVGIRQDRSPAATSQEVGPGVALSARQGKPPLTTHHSPLTSPAVNTIDLATALRLAGVQNPAILLARQRVVEAVEVGDGDAGGHVRDSCTSAGQPASQCSRHSRALLSRKLPSFNTIAQQLLVPLPR